MPISTLLLIVNYFISKKQKNSLMFTHLSNIIHQWHKMLQKWKLINVHYFCVWEKYNTKKLSDCNVIIALKLFIYNMLFPQHFYFPTKNFYLIFFLTPIMSLDNLENALVRLSNNDLINTLMDARLLKKERNCIECH